MIGPRFDVSAIRSEVEVFRVMGEVVLLKETFELLPRSKLDATRTIDIHVPPSRLFPMLPLLELSYPTRR